MTNFELISKDVIDLDVAVDQLRNRAANGPPAVARVVQPDGGVDITGGHDWHFAVWAPAGDWHRAEVVLQVAVRFSQDQSYATFKADPDVGVDREEDARWDQEGWAQFYSPWEGWVSWAGSAVLVAYVTRSQDIHEVYWSVLEDVDEGDLPDEKGAEEAALGLAVLIVRCIVSRNSLLQAGSGGNW